MKKNKFYSGIIQISFKGNFWVGVIFYHTR